jgi:hypothetical protein
MKWTPGPWRVESGNDIDRVYVVTSNPISTVPWEIACVNEHEGYTEANARLIALAPEMYETLKTMTMLVTLKYGNLDKDVWGKIVEAQGIIVKIEGEVEE